jgi:hypothetical protein
MKPRSRHDGDLLVLRPAKWLRLLSCGVVGCGSLAVAIGVVLLATGAWAGVIAVAGGLVCLSACPIARSRVVCDATGISYRLFGRECRHPREQIADLRLRPVPGVGSVARAEIEIALKTGASRTRPVTDCAVSPDHRVVQQQIATSRFVAMIAAVASQAPQKW